MPKVNPEILIWARETAGLTPEEAAKKLGLNDSAHSSATKKLAALESGEKEPTRPQVVKMADQYRRPLLTFYLSNPPRKEDRGADFRASSIHGSDHGSAEGSAAEDALLDALIRNVQARQSMVRSVLEEEEEEAEPLAFVGSHRIEDGLATVLTSLKKLLDVGPQAYRNEPNPSAAFALLRRSAENAGIFVLIKGDLGNYRTAMDTKIFRGFSIADDIAPFVVINHQDARPAWSFTLLHELVHLLLGQTGVGSERVDNENERFCDAVAGEFLLPGDELIGLALPGNRDLKEVSDRIGAFAEERNLSRTMTALRAYKLDIIDQRTFEALRDQYGQEWLSARARSRAQARTGEGGPNFYVVLRHRLGNRIADIVRRNMAANALSTSKAAIILGVKPKQIQPLLGSGAQRRW